MSEELKPCPFCGGKARLEGIDFDDYYATNPSEIVWWVHCTECGVHTEDYPAQTEAEAVKAWNRRIKPLDYIECYECQNGAPMVPYRTCHIIEDGYMDDPAVCSNCGTHYDGGRYCKYCGARVVEK